MIPSEEKEGMDPLGDKWWIHDYDRKDCSIYVHSWDIGVVFVFIKWDLSKTIAS